MTFGYSTGLLQAPGEPHLSGELIPLELMVGEYPAVCVYFPAGIPPGSYHMSQEVLMHLKVLGH